MTIKRKSTKKVLKSIDLAAIETITIKEALAYSTQELIELQERGDIEELASIYKTLVPSPQKRAARTANLVKDMLKALGYSLPSPKQPGRVASPKRKAKAEPEEVLEPVEDELGDEEKVDVIKDVKAGKEKAVKAKTRSTPAIRKKRVKAQEKELFPRNLEVAGTELVRVDCTTHKEFASLVFSSHLYGTFVVMQEDGMEGLSHFLALFTSSAATILADFPTDQGTILNVLTERLDFKKGEMVTVEASSTPLVEPFAVYVLKG